MTQTAACCPELAMLFRRTRVGATQDVGGLSLVALLLDGEGPDADLLEESIAAGHTTVTEVNESGVVGRVRVTHGGARLLLLLDGEQIVGAKQNRVLNASFLVAPGKSVDVPVSCVERGRWAPRSGSFEASGTTITGLARAQKVRRVTTSLELGLGYDADQDAVWRDVDGYLERTQTVSTTAAFQDAYAHRAADVERVLDRLAPVERQAGLAAVRSGSLVSLDLFGSAALYARAWRKLVRGLAAEIYEDAHGSPAAARPAEPAEGVVSTVLGALAHADASRTPAPGGGETAHGNAGDWTFSGLVDGGRAYHAVVVAARG